MSLWRTLLILGRVSNVPTVWSNCLAAWWLGGGGNDQNLGWLFAGTSLLYVGGMFLNDAFDVDFDRQFRRERPIPSGRISERSVWTIGLGTAGSGSMLLLPLGIQTASFGLALLLCILLYNAIHKAVTFSPVFMGFCRFLLYLTAASTGASGITGTSWALWCGLALMGYVTGISYLARRESARGPEQYWPILLLVMPIIVALIMNTNEFRQPALLLSAILGLWMLRSLRYTFWSSVPHVSRTVSHLLAGIVFVDWLAVPDVPREISAVFLGLFLLSLLLQRFVPAT
jgi:4-hydroxybenzoate polyprenyltransferase